MILNDQTRLSAIIDNRVLLRCTSLQVSGNGLTVNLISASSGRASILYIFSANLTLIIIIALTVSRRETLDRIICPRRK